MMRRVFTALMCVVTVGLRPGAQAPAQRFEAADIRVRPRTTNAQTSGGVVRSGRYDLRNATMVDLISRAYGVTPDTVASGPSWLEMTRFDIAAKVADGATPSALNGMLRTLLSDRFALVVHQD